MAEAGDRAAMRGKCMKYPWIRGPIFLNFDAFASALPDAETSDRDEPKSEEKFKRSESSGPDSPIAVPLNLFKRSGGRRRGI